MGVVEFNPQTGRVVVELQETILGFGIALENIIEKLVTDFDIEDRKPLAHRAVKVRHSQVIIVHLSSMWDDWHLIGFGEGVDFLRCGNAPDAVGVVLDHAHRFRIKQLSEP